MKDLTIGERHLIRPTNLDLRLMLRAKAEASSSRCDRSRFGAIIYNEDTQKLIAGHNEPPIPRWGLCGDNICLRSGMPMEKETHETGTNLSVSCIHAEMVALLKYLIIGMKGTAVLYLYGDSGWSLPCCDCMKNLIYVGVRKMWVAGRRDVRYRSEPPLPQEWIEAIEYGIIPWRHLEPPKKKER